MSEQNEVIDLPAVSAGEAISLVDVKNVHALELHAGRRDSDLEGFPPPAEDEGPMPLNLQLFFQDAPDQIAVRARGEFQSDQVRVVVDAVAGFEKKTPFTIAEGQQQEFIRKIGLQTLYPYIRTYVQDLAARLNAHLVLGLIRLGPNVIVNQPPEESDQDS